MISEDKLPAKRPSSPIERWYPSKEQLKDPESLERTLRQVLHQHYTLQDQFAALQRDQIKAPAASSTTSAGGPPPGSGPTDTMLCGLHVAPVDTTKLANGATLKYSKVNGNFEFS